MNIRPRKTAAELYAGVFVGEVRGVSRRASKAHLVVLGFISTLVVWALYAVFVSPFWIPSSNHDDVIVINRLHVVGSSETQSISLPHQKTPDFKEQQRHSYDLFFDFKKKSTAALYIPIHFNNLVVSLNGERLISTETRGDNPLTMWSRASLFLIPSRLIEEKNNRLTLELAESSEALLDISNIFIGAHQPLQQAYERRQFVSVAVLWVMLVGAIWAAISALFLRFVGGGRFLLATMPVSWMIAFQALLQLSPNTWFNPVAHVLLWYINGMLIVFGGLMFSHSHWCASRTFRVVDVVVILLSVAALASYSTGLVDVFVLSWWAAFAMTVMVAVLMSSLFGSAVLSIYREEASSLNPFLTQVVHSRLVVSIVLWLLALSMLGVLAQVPMVLLNVPFVMMSLNSSMVALISAIARTQELQEYRHDLKSKIEEQENQLSRLHHTHLEAMRWSVIGQSTQTLVAGIKSPLTRLSRDLDILRSDEHFGQHRKQWQRLKRCTERCSEHIRVIESLVEEDNIQLNSFRMDGFVERTMTSLQENYPFEWTLESSIRGWIEADEYYLFCVVENLVDNAYHSTNAAGRRLNLQLTMTQEDDFLRLCFKDNGLGISQSEDVFRAFHTSRAFGLGLGVNLAQKHLNGMGGFLSQVPSDSGAKFCVNLPKGTYR